MPKDVAISPKLVISFGVIMCAIATCALVFNLSILHVLATKRKLRTTTGANFIVFISIIDLIFDTSIITYSLILICSNFKLVKTQLCPMFTGLMFCCLLLNLLGVTFLGLARYLAIIRKKTLSTFTWTCIIFLPCTWVIGTTVYMFGTDHWAYTSSGVMCFPKPDKSNPYNLYFYISLTIWAFFELVILTFCYSSIILNNEKNVAKMKEYDSELNSSEGERKGHEISSTKSLTSTENGISSAHEVHINPQIKNLRLVSLKLMSILLVYYMSYIPFVIFEIAELITGKYKSDIWDLVFDLSKTLCTLTCPLISIYLHKPLKKELFSFVKDVKLIAGRFFARG